MHSSAIRYRTWPSKGVVGLGMLPASRGALYCTHSCLLLPLPRALHPYTPTSIRACAPGYAHGRSRTPCQDTHSQKIRPCQRVQRGCGIPPPGRPGISVGYVSTGHFSPPAGTGAGGCTEGEGGRGRERALVGRGTGRGTEDGNIWRTIRTCQHDTRMLVLACRYDTPGYANVSESGSGVKGLGSRV
eukprot:1578018-Rhodomonas_salina.6